MDNTDNQQFSAIFRDIAGILELQGDDLFRIRAYRRAAQTLAGLSEPVRNIARRGALESLPGIGKTLASAIQELLENGHMRYYDHLITTVPEGIVALLHLPDLSTEQVRLLWRTHDISSMKQLAQAFHAERLPFDGPTLDALAQAIAAWERTQYRMLLGVALPRADILLERLARLPLVEQVSLAGSLRRGAAMVGDINIVMASPDPPRLMHVCNQQPEIRQVLETAPTSTVVVTSEGLRVSLVAVLPAHFASALHYYTGAAAHVTALRRLAQRRGLGLTQYGVMQLERGQYLTVTDEEDLYDLLGLPWIAPELREDSGEIEAAEAGTLPELVTLADIRGDLHVQSHWGNGAHSLEDIAQMGQRLGYQYVAICDYAATAAGDRGLTPAKLAAQIAAIRRLNATLPATFHILTGIEVEISPDGEVAFDTGLLQELDVVIAAAHTGLKEPRAKLTRRLCKAMEHPCVDILAHPTGRMLGRQALPSIDVEAVLETAVETGTYLEINSHLLRLDLPDTYVRQARNLGVTLALGSEAQHIQEMRTMRLGVLTARRGWLGSNQLLNALSYDWLLRRLHDSGVPHVT
jgi:DNA polymerase (family 10)